MFVPKPFSLLIESRVHSNTCLLSRVYTQIINTKKMSSSPRSFMQECFCTHCNEYGHSNSPCPAMIKFLRDSQDQISKMIVKEGESNELVMRTNKELGSQCCSYLLQISNL